MVTLAVSVSIVWGIGGGVPMTDTDAFSGGAARPSTVSVPVAVALSVTLAVTTFVHVKVQVAPGSNVVLSLLELETKVAAPQNEPVTVTPVSGSGPCSSPCR